MKVYFGWLVQWNIIAKIWRIYEFFKDKLELKNKMTKLMQQVLSNNDRILLNIFKIVRFMPQERARVFKYFGSFKSFKLLELIDKTQKT